MEAVDIGVFYFGSMFLNADNTATVTGSIRNKSSEVPLNVANVDWFAEVNDGVTYVEKLEYACIVPRGGTLPVVLKGNLPDSEQLQFGLSSVSIKLKIAIPLVGEFEIDAKFK